MNEILLWIYLVNALLLINHEIDSAYWQEWNLFRLPGGITLFLVLHFPMLFFVLYGLILVSRNAYSGLIISLLLSFAGLFAFVIHMVFLKKGHKEFRQPISLFILFATLTASMIQAIVTIIFLSR